MARVGIQGGAREGQKEKGTFARKVYKRSELMLLCIFY